MPSGHWKTSESRYVPLPLRLTSQNVYQFEAITLRHCLDALITAVSTYIDNAAARVIVAVLAMRQFRSSRTADASHACACIATAGSNFGQPDFHWNVT